MTRSAATGSPFWAARRVLLASLTGTAVEFYDFYIYATAASLVFGALFFPSQSVASAQLSSYATFAVAFVARPIGALVFGHYGDRVGRKATLVASLLLMGGSTFAIAFLPGYARAGLAAPVLLCALRFGQGFGLGGEWGGAALLAVENAPAGYRGRFGMFPQLGAPVGFVAANGLFLLLGLILPAADFERYGWRLPFLFSAVLVGLGLWVRLHVAETPAFRALVASERPAAVPLREVLVSHPAACLAGTAGVIACFALFYIATAFALGYGTHTLGIPRTEFLGLQLVAIQCLLVSILVAGSLTDRLGARAVLVGGAGATVLVGAVTPVLLGRGDAPGALAFMAAALFVMGFVYGPLGAWLTGLFPARVRYTGVSLAFNLGGILGGGLAPVLAQRLAASGGLAPVGLYLSLAGLASLAGVLLAPRSP